MSEQNEGTQERKSGWKQWTKAEARQTLAEWKKSGLSLETFAKQQGVGAQRLRWWRKRLGKSAAPSRKKKETSVRLVPATVSLPLVDLGLGADVSIRFPVTGPVVEVMNAYAVSGEWVGSLLAAVLAARTAR